ncbi:hypothetical protein [Sphingomonas aurantiaca]|uniref:hypothetical protein n=1 Tax=Sphingomonas aurantiaca TaxID=185949 RepID=UPI002FE102B5
MLARIRLRACAAGIRRIDAGPAAIAFTPHDRRAEAPLDEAGREERPLDLEVRGRRSGRARRADRGAARRAGRVIRPVYSAAAASGVESASSASAARIAWTRSTTRANPAPGAWSLRSR